MERDWYNRKVKLVSACCLLIRPDGAVLTVSRGNDAFDLGLPGGKQEPNEPLDQTAARELREETGVRISPEAVLTPVFTAEVEDFQCTTFTVKGPLTMPGKLEGKPFEGYVRWAQPYELCQPFFCTFEAYNSALFEKLGMLKT